MAELFLLLLLGLRWQEAWLLDGAGNDDNDMERFIVGRMGASALSESSRDRFAG